VKATPGAGFRRAVSEGLVPCIGVYDVFSASIAGRRFPALFVSGFGFAASHYGLPDVGFIAWPDILAFVRRIRSVLPDHHLLVDVDDGYCDVEVACHVARELEAVGASGIVLEDQRRPRRCGHLDGKQILELEDFLPKLERVLAARTDLFVVARTDASEPDEILRRARAFEQAGADAVLADGLPGLEHVGAMRRGIAGPIAFNQIRGGKSGPLAMEDMARAGVSIAIYSTPCLFAAQAAVEDAVAALAGTGHLDAGGRVDLANCNRLLQANHAREVAPPVRTSDAAAGVAPRARAR
jgi:2-methylisocitrate lyase-like PEP mutase family enzyme